MAVYVGRTTTTNKTTDSFTPKGTGETEPITMQEVLDYLKASGRQVILGNYTDDVTMLGTAGQIGSGLLGVDLPGDIRDLSYDVTNWEWSWSHVGMTALDAMGLLPIVGAVKYVDEAGVLLKNSDEAAAALKGITNSSKDLKVIGRLEDTIVAREWKGHDVLNDPNWTLSKNDEWVNAGIKNKQDFYIASPMNEKNLISSNPKYPGETVFAREIRMLKEAGYVQKGDYFIHPDNLK